MQGAQERYQLIMRYTRDIVLILETDGKIIEANQQAVETYQYSYEELMHMRIQDLRGPATLAIVQEQLFQAEKAGIVFKTTHKRKDGSTFPVEVGAGGTNLEGRRVILSIIRDISEKEETKEALIASETRWQLAVQGSNDIIREWDLQTGQMFISDRWTEMTGGDPGEKPRTIEEFIAIIHPEDIPVIRESLFSHFRKKSPFYRAEYRVRKKDGSYMWILARGQALWEESGWAIRVVGSAMDIDDRRRMEEKIRAEQKKLQILLESAPYGIVLLDNRGVVQYTNPMFTSITGYSLLDVPSMYIFNKKAFPDADVYHRATEAWPRIVADPSQSGTLPVCCQDGGQRYLEFRASVLEGGAVTVAIVDVTEHRKAEEERLYLSTYDSLTGVYNRSSFEKALREMDRPGNYPLSIIVGDVNGLKLVNDAFGHRQGDALLVKIAGLLQEACGKDTLISRCGGDEFGILLPRTDEKTAYHYCERIQQRCRECDSEPIQPSIALGVATKNAADISRDRALSEAESKMYRNKLLESKSVRSAILSSLEATLYERTAETREHAQRMNDLCVRFGRVLNVSDFEIGRLAVLARLHDIGKIGIPDEILLKPGPLTTDEFYVIQTHPEIGFRIAHTSYELSFIAEEILCHHERWDGKGYPKGLQGDEIPVLAQILAIVDTYDVMTHDRVYRRAVSAQEALEEISRNAGTQFNPELTRIFVQWMKEQPET